VLKVLTILCVAACLCASLACTTDVTGVWRIEFTRDTWREPSSVTCTFTQPDNQPRVDCADAQFVSARMKGRQFSWQFTSGENQSISATFSGEFKDGAKTIKGTWQFVDSSSNTSGGGTFKATRN
jgi:hypothetical protein